MEEASDFGYIVECGNCPVKYDALSAAWCVCLTHDPSVVCPECHGCFCAATPEFKREFWAEAPPLLWERRAAERQSRSATSTELRPSPLARPLVLVVDDEPAMRNLAVFVLDRMGYGSLTAADGDEAFALAAKYLPDLILSDALMPKTDGRELCRRVKMHPETRSVKFVLMTSVYKRRRYEGEAYVQFGVDGFLPKPVSLVELKTELQRQLGNSNVPVLESRSKSGTARVAAEVSA